MWIKWKFSNWYIRTCFFSEFYPITPIIIWMTKSAKINTLFFWIIPYKIIKNKFKKMMVKCVWMRYNHYWFFIFYFFILIQFFFYKRLSLPSKTGNWNEKIWCPKYFMEFFILKLNVSRSYNSTTVLKVLILKIYSFSELVALL